MMILLGISEVSFVGPREYIQAKRVEQVQVCEEAKVELSATTKAQRCKVT